MPAPMKVLMVTLVALGVAAGALQLHGHDRISFVVATSGTSLTLIGMALWIGLVDSKDVWPSDKKWMSRLGRVLEFQQSEKTQRARGTWSD